MARLLYGATSGDYTMTTAGRVIPNAVVQIWDAIEGGNQITDLTDYDGNPCTVVTSGADGLVRFYGPDGENDNLWMDSRQGSRLLVRPTVLTASIGDGSILDEDIAADADIDRSKIAGTALTADSMGVFSVLDYGAVGDGETDDTDAIQAAIDAATAAGGGIVTIPAGTFRCNVVLKPQVTLRGQGVKSTILKPATGSNATVITGLDFATLTGRVFNSAQDPSEDEEVYLGCPLATIERLTIDGDKANQSAGWGIQVWGLGMRFTDIQVQNCNDGGVWTEFTQHRYEPMDDMHMSIFENITIFSNGGDGWRWRGPHDSRMNNVAIAKNTGWGINGDVNTGSLVAYGLNSWNNTAGSFTFESPTELIGCLAGGGVGSTTGVVFTRGPSRFKGSILHHHTGIVANGVMIDVDVQGLYIDGALLQVGTTGTDYADMVSAKLSGTDVGTVVDRQYGGPIIVSGRVGCTTLYPSPNVYDTINLQQVGGANEYLLQIPHHVTPRKTFSNYPATVAATTRYLGQVGTMSGSHAVTLPLAAAVPAGAEIVIADESGTVTGVNTIVITRAGSDLINGATTSVIDEAYGFRRLVSDGTSAWTVVG